jgi:hypothetical protein
MTSQPLILAGLISDFRLILWSRPKRWILADWVLAFPCTAPLLDQVDLVDPSIGGSGRLA